MAEKLLVASGNKGKIKEIEKFLVNLNRVRFQILGLNDFPQLEEVKEDGDTFRGNALKKARERAEVTGLLTLADDSGLLVDYLDGRPGVYSARYAGKEATDSDNNRKLIAELKGIPWDKRTAHFVCVIALVDPISGEEIVVEGRCDGIIGLLPRGENGFGYDPLFFIPEYDKTMAELKLEIKNRISHRAKALQRMKEILSERYS